VGRFPGGQLLAAGAARRHPTTEVDQDAYEYLHEVVLTISNFGTEPIDLEVVDVWQPEAEAFTFSAEPAKESGNVLRWEVTVEPGEEEVIKYSFRVD
jgi:hypothetical protein